MAKSRGEYEWLVSTNRLELPVLTLERKWSCRVIFLQILICDWFADLLQLAVVTNGHAGGPGRLDKDSVVSLVSLTEISDRRSAYSIL